MEDNPERLIKEKKALQERAERAERENRLLKRSIYDLSVKVNEMVSNMPSSTPFDVEAALEGSPAAVWLAHARELAASDERAQGETVPRDPRHFSSKYDLTGHSGAVYALQFAPSGQLLASASFDHTVRLWDVSVGSETTKLMEHEMGVMDVSWGENGNMLASGGLDHRVVVWDMRLSKAVLSTTLNGFVQSITFNPAPPFTLFTASTDGAIHVLDVRMPSADLTVMQNDCMVNSLFCLQDGRHVLSGDSHGIVKAWDSTSGEVAWSIDVSPSHRPVTHVHCSPPRWGDDVGAFLAVNCYDNVLRVYSRRPLALPSTDAASAPFVLRHAVTGIANRSWPIHSTFHQGREYRPYREEGSKVSRSRHQSHRSERPPSRGSSGDSGGQRRKSVGSAEESGNELITETELDVSGEAVSVHDSLLLVSGSAEPAAYVFDVGGGEGSGRVLQRLEGHTDRVYCASMHPLEPVVATGSADCQVKVWTARMKAR